MAASIRALVAVDSSADREVVQESLPAIEQIEIVGVIFGLDESWSEDLTLREWWSRLAGAGWAFPAWPKGHGGRGSSPLGLPPRRS